MGNKAYKKGMEDAAKAYEAFGNKQEEALEFILEEVRSGKCTLEEAVKKLDAIGGNVDNLYKYLKGKEKAQLYSVYTPLDIANLEYEEKLFLVGALFRLTVDKMPTDEQQKFIRSIQRYLDIKEPPFGTDISAIENIESMNAQKAIYQVILEYLMLQEGDSFDETDLQNTFLESFNLNNKNRQIIEEHVRLLYIATGAEGFVEKYGFVDDEFYDDEASSVDESNDTVEETQNEDPVEEYIGIPLKFAEKLCVKDACHNFSGDGAFYNQQICFETKNYFVTQNNDWIAVDKIEKKEKKLNSINECFTPTDIPPAFYRNKNSGAGSGANYVVDYGKNLLYFISKNNLFCLNINTDSVIKYNIDIPSEFVQSMQVFNNLILMSSNEKLFYFDVKDEIITVITDACGRDISGTSCTATILNETIYFYTNSGDNLSADDGGNLSRAICVYDINQKTLSRGISLNSQWSSIEALFSINNTVYAIQENYDINSAGCDLRKIVKNDDVYSFEIMFQFAGCKYSIYQNWFCCYKYDESYSSSQALNSIVAYDFSKNKAETIATDCFCYKNDGVFKPKWIKTKTDFKVLGEWLYYICDCICLDLTVRKETCSSHIYRANLNVAMSPVDLGSC